MKYLPGILEIKQLEKNSQKQGTGITYEDLLGIWKLKFVWKQNSDDMDNLSSSILQVLSAKLELRKESEVDEINFKINNSINFGLLDFVFSGKASLKGSRPILLFYFENFKVNIGKFSILKKSLKKPEEKKFPFFSLISLSKKDNWMCARGKGGGLAIWIKS